MKKMIAAFAALLMLVSLLAGCGSTPAPQSQPSQSLPEASPPQIEPDTEPSGSVEPVPEVNTSSKTLVVYYRASQRLHVYPHPV